MKYLPASSLMFMLFLSFCIILTESVDRSQSCRWRKPSHKCLDEYSGNATIVGGRGGGEGVKGEGVRERYIYRERERERGGGGEVERI